MTPIDGIATSPLSRQRQHADSVVTIAVKRSPEPAPMGDLEAAVKSINDYLREGAKDLQFSIDRSTGKTIVRVVKAGTGEVIRQMPSEEALEIARAIDHSIRLFLHEAV